MNRPRNKARTRRFYKRKGFWLTLTLLGLLVAAAGWIAAERYTRPFRERAETYDLERINDLEVPSLILDRNGKEIGRFFVQNRSVIPIGEVPDVLIDALRAGEDSRFYTHKGVDYIGIIRAAKMNFESAGRVTDGQGASTITQQLARNAYNLRQEALRRNESGIERKLVEAFLARRIERRYTKRQILEFYLNRIYFGSGFHGIRSASLGYFGKEPMELNASEAASIVGLIKNPTNLSPLNDLEANRRARDYVLSRMVKEGFLKRKDAARLKEQPVKLNSRPLQRGTTHLYERVGGAVAAALGDDALAAGGFTIHTTILREAQEAAEKALEDSLSRAETNPGYTRGKRALHRKDSGKTADYVQGAVLAVDHETGEVLAYVGGRDYAQVPYDFIEQGKRPLGTAFFPFLYAAALSGGESPATLLEDDWMDNRTVMVGGREGVLGEWGMEVPSPDYERAEIPLRRAFEHSKIAATVRLGSKIGLGRIVETAENFGLPLRGAELLPRICVGWERASLPQAVRGISAFARGGKLGPAELVYVDRIVNADGRVVFRRQPRPQTAIRATDDATAWQIHSMMAGSLERGSSAGALDGLVRKPFQGAGKGGSTHDFADAWFLGYNKRVTCGVWTGFLQGADPIYPGAFSRDLAMPVWQATVNALSPSFGGESFTPPDSVVEVDVCTRSGERATQFCQELEEDVETAGIRSRSTSITDYFRKGSRPLPFCSVHSGALPEGISPDLALANLPAIDAIPVLPAAPALVGNDPYHTELPGNSSTSESGGFISRRTNVLDSLDLGDAETSIPLPRPKRLEIYEN